MLLDLVLPLECGGCGAPSTRWCDSCRRALAVRLGEPLLVTPRLDPGVPVFSLGRYAGARREAILGVKERGRGDLVEPLGRALGGGVRRLVEWGILGVPVVLVPAPSRRAAARRRGGDPVTRAALVADTAETEAKILSLSVYSTPPSKHLPLLNRSNNYNFS